jgi:hypothetical protein
MGRVVVGERPVVRAVVMRERERESFALLLQWLGVGVVESWYIYKHMKGF